MFVVEILNDFVFEGRKFFKGEVTILDKETLDAVKINVMVMKKLKTEVMYKC